MKIVKEIEEKRWAGCERQRPVFVGVADIY